MTYAEMLRANGATDEDVKLLDTPSARRVFDAQQAAITAANDKATRLETETRDWFDNVSTPEWNQVNADLIKAKTEAARLQAALRTAEDRGLLNISKDLGLDLGNPANPNLTNPNPANPAGFDPSKYVTMDQLKETARLEGAAIAQAQDITAEHGFLFPGQRLNFTSLREEAMAAKKQVMQYWLEKYKVPEARAAKEKAAQDAHDKKIAEDAVTAARAEWVKTNGSNPDLRVPAESRSPFVVRKDSSDLRSTQPWARNDNDLSNDRVRRAVEKQQQREMGRAVQ